MTLHPLPLLAAAVLVVAAAPARAKLIDIVWDSGGRFEQRIELAPGAFAETCGRLAKGMAVRWDYGSAGALDFNIHFHEGEKVVFPVKRHGAAHAAGTLKVRVDQDYCWMWTNKSAHAVALRLSLSR